MEGEGGGGGVSPLTPQSVSLSSSPPPGLPVAKYVAQQRWEVWSG